MQKKELVDIDIDLQDLIPQFLANRKNDMTLLGQLAEKNDLEELSKLAHKIKGAAAGYGFSTLSSYADKIEQLAKRKEASAIPSLVSTMKSHFDSIEVRFVPM